MKVSKDRLTLKWIFTVAGSGNKWTLALLLVRILQAGLGVGYALLLGQVIDGAVSGDQRVFFWRLGAFALLIVGSLLLQGLSRVFTEKATTILTKNFRSQVFSALMTRSYSDMMQVHSGEWMNRLTSDTGVVVSAWVQMLPGLSGTLVRLGSAMAALLVMLPKLVYLLLPAGLVMAGLSLVFRKKLKTFHVRIQRAEGAVRSFFQERLGSLLIVRSFTQERRTVRMADELMETVSKARMRRIHFVNLCNTVLHLALYGAQILGVGMCGWNILHQQMSYGSMSSILHLVGQMEAPLANISGYLPQYYAMLASAERLMEPESYEKDIKSTPVENLSDFHQQELGALGLDKVSFSYADGDRQVVLRDLSLQVRKGESVALVGESGCGKSTVMKLLLGLYTPENGQVYVERKDGSREILDGTWRGLFAYVPQGNQLFSGTIRQTLTFEDPEMMTKDEMLWAALDIACAGEFVRQQPKGLDAVLGERGSGLSEGQIQRLAIARAVLSRRPVLLLDEATSALDGDTEKQVLQNLHTMTDRTILLITHREAGMEACSRKIQLKKAE